jgi:hypothetical protein
MYGAAIEMLGTPSNVLGKKRKQAHTDAYKNFLLDFPRLTILEKKSYTMKACGSGVH